VAARSNLNRPEWEERRQPEGFGSRRARLGRQAGCREIGITLFELPSGEAAYPYHWHLAEEELLVVLYGAPRLRTPAGWEDLEQGDVVSFPVGEEGAHQLLNSTKETVRFLAVSNQLTEVVVYPDSGKLGAFDDRPDGHGLRHLFRIEDQVGYWEGEEPPG